MGQRASGMVALALALTLAAALVPAAPAEAAKVLLFYSSRYTHLGGTAANGHPMEEQEADNLKAAMVALGENVTTIAGPDDPVGNCGFGPGGGYTAPGTRLASASEYQAALANADVFVIPEHSRFCSMAFDITTDIVNVWQTWVAQGGGLVISVGFEGKEKIPSLLEVVFGFHLVGLDGLDVTTTRRAAAATTLFATGPATLPGNSQMGLITLASLPAGSASIYDDGTNSSVMVIPYGAGKVILFGWDWSYSDPPWPGDQNGGWYPAILQGAIDEARTKRLTVVANAGGTVSGTPAGVEGAIACGALCSAHFPRSTSVTLTAAAQPGWTFTGWSGGGCSGMGTCTVALTQDVLVNAMFLMLQSFADVPESYWAHDAIQALVAAGVTAGCTGGSAPNYCPEAPVTRDAMAVFLLKAKDGPGVTLDPCVSAPFADVPCSSSFAPWIQELVARGITSGCGGGAYCPGSVVTRAQMAVFLLKTLGVTPAPCTSSPFADVPCSSPFAPWVQELVRRGVTAGCGGSSYCPDAPVTRAEMAVFLVKAFNLPMP
jgi:hypothetical protein